MTPLSPTQIAVLQASRVDGDRRVIYRGVLDLANGCAPSSTLYALAARGLVELRTARVSVYSKARCYYKGMRTVLDHAFLTEAGVQVLKNHSDETGHRE